MERKVVREVEGTLKEKSVDRREGGTKGKDKGRLWRVRVVVGEGIDEKGKGEGERRG